MTNYKCSCFSIFLTLLFTSCSHYSINNKYTQSDEHSLIYNLMGTKAEFLNNQIFDQDSISKYEKQVHVEKIISLSIAEYKEWLEVTAKHFVERTKPDSLYRYIGRDLFFKASILEKYGHLEKAEGLFSLLFQHFGVTEEALVHHAVLVLKLGELEKARISLKRAVEIAQEDDRKVDLIQVWLNIAEAIGNTSTLHADFSYAMKMTKSHTTVCARYGKYLNDKKQDSAAITLLKKCLNNTENIESMQPVSLELAKIYIQKLNFDQAFKILERYQSIKNVDADIILLLGLLYEQSGNEKKQLEVLNKYINEGGQDNRILERVADYYFEKNIYDKGLTPLKVLADVNPQNLNYKFRLALANLQLGNYQQTVNLLMELQSMGGNSAQIGLYMFKAYSGLQDFDKALSYLKMFDADEAVQLEALMLVGDYFTQRIRTVADEDKNSILNQWNEFLSGYKKVENTIEWKLQYAMTLEANNQIAEAIDVLEKSKTTLEFQEFQLYYLASLYETLKQYEKTDIILVDILKKNPDFSHAWNFLGYIQLERPQGNLEIAKTSIMKAIELDPKSAHFRDSLGWYFYKVGQWEKALKELQIAHTLDNKDITIAKHLIQVLVSMKQLPLAQDMLKRLSQNFPKEDLREFNSQLKLDLDRSPASE